VVECRALRADNTGMTLRRRLRDEAGFSILECTIALTVVFVVLLALLGAGMATTARTYGLP